jgi:hypothetical protein
MKPRQDLPRLRSLSSELSGILGAAADDEPTGQQLARLDHRLAPLLQPSDAPPSLGPNGSAPRLHTAGRLVRIGTFVGLGVLVLGGAAVRRHGSSHADAAILPLGTVVAVPVAPASPPAQWIEVTPLAETIPPSPAPPSAIPAARFTAKAVISTPHTEPVATPTPSAAPTEDDDPRAEASLLLGAHQLLQQGDSAGALRMAGQHARRFPHGVLGEEREAIVIEALARSGQVDVALARAQAFHAEFPGSTYGRRVDQAVERGARP